MGERSEIEDTSWCWTRWRSSGEQTLLENDWPQEELNFTFTEIEQCSPEDSIPLEENIIDNVTLTSSPLADPVRPCSESPVSLAHHIGREKSRDPVRPCSGNEPAKISEDPVLPCSTKVVEMHLTRPCTTEGNREPAHQFPFPTSSPVADPVRPCSERPETLTHPRRKENQRDHVRPCSGSAPAKMFEDPVRPCSTT